MSQRSDSDPRPLPRLLVVCESPSTLEQVQWAFAGHAELRVLDQIAAWSATCGQSFDGAILDSGLPERMSSLLTNAFLRHQPTGRIAVISSADEPTSVMSLALRESRVEILYQPLDFDTLRNCLLRPEVPAGLGDFVVP